MQGISATAFGLSSAYQKYRVALEKSVVRLTSGDRFANVGDGNAAGISISERFRLQIKSGEASEMGIQNAQSYLDTTDAYAQQVTDIVQRMTEIAGTAANGLLSSSDRQALDTEFQSLRSEITDLTRTSAFLGKQTIGREGLASYDSTTGQLRYWQANGNAPEAVARDFSASAVDAKGNLIGFDNAESFTWSRDGKSLYFMGHVAGDDEGTLRVKKYDLATNTVTYGASAFATQDALYVDETGSLYANGDGTFYHVDASSLAATATALSDGRAGTKFTVYQGNILYSRSSDNAIVSGDATTGTTTALTGPLSLGTSPAFSGSARYVAEESSAGNVRVIDTHAGNEATLHVGDDASVNSLCFNADGDRLYYVNKVTNAIESLAVNTDGNGLVVVTTGGKVVQGSSSASLNGLSSGGASPSTATKFLLSEDNTSWLSYEAIDLSLYNLGLANARVDTLSEATEALSALPQAQTRISAERAKVGAMASRFSHVLDAHKSYLENIGTAESTIRDIDMAEEAAEFSVLQVNQSAAIAIIAQFNTLSKNVLTLLQG